MENEQDRRDVFPLNNDGLEHKVKVYIIFGIYTDSQIKYAE